MPKWIDLSNYNAKLTGILFPDGKKRLVISGIKPGSSLWNRAVELLDFFPATSGKTLLRNDTRISKNEFKRVFMLLKVRDFSEQEILHIVPQAPERNPNTGEEQKQPTKQEEIIDKEELVNLKTTKVLGFNFRGDEVFEGESGRFIRSKKQNTVFTEEDIKVPASFLRYDGTDKGLQLCASGLVYEMANGKHFKQNTILNFASTIYGKPIDDFAKETHIVQEAVEAAINNYIARHATSADKETFELAKSLYERQPPTVFRTGSSVALQQFSTPSPLAVAAQRLLGNTSGKWVLEPTIGNGSLVQALPEDSQIIGVELDEQRLKEITGKNGLKQKTSLCVYGDATQCNFQTILASESVKLPGAEPLKEYDYVIANPPFGGLSQPITFSGMRVTRLDQLIVLRSLAARADNGRAVFVVGADHENIYPGKEGILNGGSKNFFNWLVDHYEVEDAFEVLGKLYKKQGSSYPVRVITVGHKRSEAEAQGAYNSKEYRIEKLSILRSWDEIWEHANNVRLKRKEAQSATPEKIVDITEDVPQPAPNPELASVNKKKAADTGKPQPPSAETKTSKDFVDNIYQAPYISSSTVAEPSSMIPRNLLAPSQIALGKVEQVSKDEGFDTIEDFLVNRLNTFGIDKDHIQKVFSAEQIDALALGIYQAENKRELIVGDQTGLGKGRILAGLALYAVNGLDSHVIFLTETQNLFSDFWRDICDVCDGAVDPVRIFKPFILNANSSIKDQENKIVFKRTTPAERKEVTGTTINPLKANGYNIMFATYSQFNRLPGTSPKAQWLPVVADQGFLIKDESHNAAGDSNTAENIKSATEHALSGVSSSATFAKKSQNLLAYVKAFPEGVCDDNLNGIMAIGGEPLQEIMSGMLAEDGVFVRREHDLSELEFDTFNDLAHLSNNEYLSDQLSGILLEMSYLSGDISTIIKGVNKEFKKRLKELPEEARKGNRMSVSSVNFGSRLYNILRQFMLAIKVDATSDLAIKALQEGRKPIIVVEQTMETILKETLFKDYDDDEKDSQKSIFESGGTELERLTFRDILLRVLDKISVVVKRNDYGNVERNSIYFYCKNDTQQQNMKALVDGIRDRILQFPDLDISPLDSVRHKIEQAGYFCGEISGRSMYLKFSENNRMIAQPRDDDRLKTIYEFNAGQNDAIILTRAGSTGLSLHSSVHFKDQRQREVIELQIANDVNSRMQFFGRANRKGQVCAPIIRTISSGLPAEIRILAMQNDKLRKLSANTQSNRENVAELDDIPDILNPLGGRICYGFLIEHYNVANQLGIKIDDDDTVVDFETFAHKLTGRIALLPVREQKKIYAELTSEYKTALSELEAKGENPFKTHIYDLKARTVNRELYEGVEQPSYMSVFDAPVYLSTLEWETNVDPIRFNQVQQMVEYSNKQAMFYHPELSLTENIPALKPLFKQILNTDKMNERLRDLYQKKVESIWEQLSRNKDKSIEGFNSFTEAAYSNQKNPIATIFRKANWHFHALCHVRPGINIELTPLDEEGNSTRDDSFTGVIVDIQYPETGSAFCLGQYKFRVAIPGEASPRTLSFNMLHKDYARPKYPVYLVDDTREDTKKMFNSAIGGKIIRTRTILDGNLFRAAQVATENQLGRAAVYTDENGVNHRAIILKAGITQKNMHSVPVKITSPAVAAKFLENIDDDEPQLKTYIAKTASSFGAIICREHDSMNHYMIFVSGTKKTGGEFFLNDGLRKITGDFHGNRTTMKVTFPKEKLPEVLSYISKQMRKPLYAEPKHRKFIQELLSENVNQKIAQTNDEQVVPVEELKAAM